MFGRGHFILLSILSALICGQKNWAQDERLRLLNFDIGEFETIAGQNVSKLKGNVQLQQGQAKLSCQEAIWYEAEERVILERQVVIDDGEKILTADYVLYFMALKKIEARGHVKIIDSLRTLMSEKLTYFENEEKIIADKQVKIIDTERHVELTGGHAEYFRNNDSVLVTFNPVFIQQDSLGKEQLRIHGQLMEFARLNDLAMVTDSVLIVKDTTEARCDVAEFWRKLNKIILRGTPRIWQRQNQIKGDSIELYLKGEDLVQARILHQAEVISRADSIDATVRWNKLTGQLVTIYFSQNQMDHIEVENQATSWYHLIENKKYKGLNRITGDKLSLFLTGGRIKRIRFESQPAKSSGTFYPPGHTVTLAESEKIVTHHHQEGKLIRDGATGRK